MYNLCVFAGTTEGRKLVEFLSSQPVSVHVYVATDYGEALLPTKENLTVSAKRLSAEELLQELKIAAYDLVIDATHPYATAVTEQIAAACGATGTEYLRLLRSASDPSSEVTVVADSQAAAEVLDGTEGNILLTVGSKELASFSAMKHFAERVYVRVLPLDASLRACAAAGVKAAHVLAMQGPFSEEMNIASLHFASAAWLVTKDGGAAGGVAEKLSAAKKVGARVLVIGRPMQREGLSFSETIQVLCTRFDCRFRPQVQIVGMGPGNPEAMTKEARKAIAQADCLIGAKRMLEGLAAPEQTVYEAIAAEDIARWIQTHTEYQRYAVVLSGDVGFFSGAKKLLPRLEHCQVTLFPGLSSLSYFCARLHRSYEEVLVTSTHGRAHSVVPEVQSHRYVFVLVGGTDGISRLCASLVDAGLGTVTLWIGERLSYPEERITQGTALELLHGTYAALSVALIENPAPQAIVAQGLPDRMFQRGSGTKGVVPMTKSEVRAICFSKLQLTENAIAWDIGAGTGSVTVEMALQAKRGEVYAVERNPAAIPLLQQNKARFYAENITIVEGCAPEICQTLPVPSHVFLGGSGGNLREILSLLLKKNPNVRIVATAISLESIAEWTAYCKEFSFLETEVVSVQIAHGQPVGAYHLMMGQNPIFIFTVQAGGTEV